MEKIERILERYKIYLGVKDVKLVVGSYKTRSAFTNLTSSPPTIYLNKYLIDDEEILDYLILREIICIKLNMYRSRYGGGLSYAEKFDGILHFYTKGEAPGNEGKDGKTDRGEPKASMTSFFSGGRPAPRLGRRAPPEGCLASMASKRKRKKRLIRLQVQTYRSNHLCKERPAKEVPVRRVEN